MSAGNAAALAGKAPDPSAGNKKPLPPGEVAAVRLTERAVGADSISARFPLSRLPKEKTPEVPPFQASSGA